MPPDEASMRPLDPPNWQVSEIDIVELSGVRNPSAEDIVYRPHMLSLEAVEGLSDDSVIVRIEVRPPSTTERPFTATQSDADHPESVDTNPSPGRVIPVPPFSGGVAANVTLSGPYDKRQLNLLFKSVWPTLRGELIGAARAVGFNSLVLPFDPEWPSPDGDRQP
jgi:hypothetical protein